MLEKLKEIKRLIQEAYWEEEDRYLEGGMIEVKEKLDELIKECNYEK